MSLKSPVLFAAFLVILIVVLVLVYRSVTKRNRPRVVSSDLQAALIAADAEVALSGLQKLRDTLDRDPGRQNAISVAMQLQELQQLIRAKIANRNGYDMSVFALLPKRIEHVIGHIESDEAWDSALAVATSIHQLVNADHD